MLNHYKNLKTTLQSLTEPERSVDVLVAELLTDETRDFNPTVRALRNGKPSCPEFTNIVNTTFRLIPDGFLMSVTYMEDGRGIASIYKSSTAYADIQPWEGMNPAIAILIAIVSQAIDELEKQPKIHLDGAQLGFTKRSTSRDINIVIPSEDAVASTLYWGEDNIRQGWFLRRGNNSVGERVMGPSICVTSGGGPMQAMRAVHSHYQHTVSLTIEVPEHTTISGEPCKECSDITKAWNDELQLRLKETVSERKG